MAYAPVQFPQNTSASNVLSQLQTYALRRTALEQLRTKFQFHKVCMPDVLKLREGKTRRWYRYTNFAAQSSGVQEGIVPTSLNVAPSKTLDAVCTQYTDYVTISDVLRDTAPDDILMNQADNLGYRAGLTVDNVTRGAIDAESGAEQALQGTYLNVRDFRAAFWILQGRNVPFMDSGYYEAIVHPYNAFDVVNDPSANGYADIFKYTDADKAGLNKIADRDLITVVAGCRITSSTNVKMTSGSPNEWRTYIVGRQAVGTVSLTGYEPSKVTDPNKEDFSIKTRVFKDIDVANPTGQIGALASYNFMHVAKVLEGPSPIGGSYRLAWIDAPSSIVS